MKIILLIKKYFKRIVLVLNIGSSLLLLLSYLSPFISPLIFYPIAFLGLIYPFLLLVNLVFAVYWIVLKSKLTFISIISILVGYSYIGGIVQFNANKSEYTSSERSLEILSYNVRVFDHWKWSAEKYRANKIFDYIKSTKSDIVCLQEFYSRKTTGKDALDSLTNGSGLNYVHVQYTKKNNKPSNYGIATFSTFPIVEKGSIKINSTDNYCIYTDLKIFSDTLRVYNIHLESIHLGQKDYVVIENINNEDTVNVKGLKNIYWKFKKSYKKRAAQVKTIVDHISSCKYPIVLCGDFNDTPVSFVYKELTDKLTDAYRVSGNGLGYTYIYKYPTFRIDYILHSPRLTSFNYQSNTIELSDHFPVQCSIRLHSSKVKN